uniref:nuclear transport factor 2 family protein n=1 Tax=Paractinoplanes polyasparticus TaxID=2856853 RepID=UPI0021021A94|nr:nuclear transport factor 2 family protein [Actinoplanes polyasparticus]
MTDARDLIERFNAAWAAGDLAAVAECLADDVTYSPNAWDGPARAIHGRAAVTEAFADHLGPGPVLGPVWAAGDRVVCEWQWEPAEDGSVLHGLDLYRIHNGRIAAKDVYGKITTGPEQVLRRQ